MSVPWSPLLPLALIGTDRPPGAMPHWPGEIGELIERAAASADHPATGVLRIAAILASCGLAGDLGLARAAALPAGAPPDRQPALQDAGLLGLTGWTLREGPLRLQHELLATLAATGLRLPASLLPAALDLSRRSLALRPGVAGVLGERGRWLAALRDDWRHAAGVPDGAAVQIAWDQGSLDQRRTLLREQRLQDPAAARKRLATTLPELPAHERAELAAVLVDGLGGDDEALLDSLRTDRSREVRQVALKLLLRLPTAAHPRRAGARMAAQLKPTRALLGPRWTLDAPLAAADDWAADQVDAERPKHEALGERAWWLYQLVRQLPLAWWPTHTGQTPAELLAWASGSDWAEALQRGWHEVLLAAPDLTWADAMLDAWPGALKHHEPAAVLALLPPAVREQRWQQQLRAGGAAALEVLLPQILAGSPPPQTWSPEMSAALLDAVTQRLQAGPLVHDGLLRAHLVELACALFGQALPQLHTLPRSADETPAVAALMHSVAQVAATRAALATLAAPTSVSFNP